MTKLQKIGLSVSVVAAILWTVWLFAWWNYSFPVCDQPYWCVFGADYNLIHFVLIAVFAIWIDIILVDISKKSLKTSCIVLLISWMVGKCCVWIGVRLLNTMCGWDCTIVDIPGQVFLIFWLICIPLWLISLFFTVSHLTHNNKLGIYGVLILVGLLGAVLIQGGARCEYLLSCIKDCSKAIFLVFFIVSIILCVISFIRSHKEVKKSS